MNDREGQRNYWLDHFYQYFPGSRRPPNSPRITKRDYIGIPIPKNMPTPLGQPCLIWRWGLSNGYGTLQGKGTHVVAFEQAGKGKVSEGEQVDHLCHRPFCLQPDHLYLGNNKTNAEDRQALSSGMIHYPTWELVGDRLEKAMLGPNWKEPQSTAMQKKLSDEVYEPLECPHDFDTIRSAGTAQICMNCNEIKSGASSDIHHTHCREIWSEAPECRCEACSCRQCLLEMLSAKRSRVFERTGGWPIHNLGGELPNSLFDETEPIDREEAQKNKKSPRAVEQRFPDSSSSVRTIR